MFSQKPNILFVDDEENNLLALKSTFRKKYNVFTALNVESAWELIHQEDIHIVISDQRMPGQSGVEFLEKLYFSKPDIVRILLTGYEDIKPVIEAINKGRIYRYVSKPWEENDLLITLDNAYEKYKTQRLLQIKNQELQKAYSELDHLVYSASHNIREPLTSILGITKLGRLESNREAQLEFYDYIDESVNKLESILRSIVDYSRNSRMESTFEKIDFVEILHHVQLDIAETESFYGKVTIYKEINQEYDFYGDKGRMLMIIENLLRNAIRFANLEGENKSFVKVDIETTSHGVEINIKDNGIGIHPEEIERVFQMFYRGNNLSKGSGMGLYIVSEAIEKLGGKISVDSSYGKGTEFSVSIPCVKEKKKIKEVN